MMEKMLLDKKLTTLTEKIITDENFKISAEEALYLTEIPDRDIFDLIACANKIRRHYKGDAVVTCSITNAKSGLCSEDCAFCAQSVHHRTNISTYPLLGEEELVAKALDLYARGATEYSMVTSGYMLNDEEIEVICRAARRIKEMTGMIICSSLGILTYDRAKKLKESGITNYHHNLETARSFFSHICTTHDYEDDVETVRVAKEVGFRVCSGGILGMGESWEQRVELALTIRELDVDSIPINFLNPIEGTRMEGRPLLSPREALKCIALFRFINPKKDITICGGREVTLRDLQGLIFAAGANGFLIGNYLTTLGRDIESDIKLIEDLGLVTRRDG